MPPLPTHWQVTESGGWSRWISEAPATVMSAIRSASAEATHRLARGRVDAPDFQYPLRRARRRRAGVHPHDLVGVLAESPQKKKQRKK